MRATSLPVWLLRVAWVGLLAAIPALGAALDGRSGAVQIVAATGLWFAWAAGLVATLVPSPASLTVVRVLAPAAPLVAVAASIAGAGALASIVAIAVGVVAVIVAFTAEVGHAFVQASAYGDEARLLLRPPGPLVAGPLELAWLVLAATAAGPLLLAARAWVAGAVLTVVGVAIVVSLARRFHRLALRWFVFVPAGVVIRDPLVLSDTAMVRRATVAALRLAPATTTATDLTAKALGPAVELDLTGPANVMMAGTFSERSGHTV
ncbi:MAG TPA: hypothetical protein VKD67_08395, partial [Acidimicrobiales bacterium]|nr:hypothetical protein [Acidimicrobiales bacterium]